MKEAILVTGCAGMMGSIFVKYLIENTEYEVVGIDNLSAGYFENIHPDCKFHLRDVTQDLSDVFTLHDIKYVYHMAAYAAEGQSPFIRKFNYTQNLLATANIVNHCINHGAKKLIFLSSMSVYGNGVVPFEETDIPAPIDPYAIAKYASELDIKAAYNQHGLRYTIVRPHNIVSPNQNIWDKYRNVIGIWIRQLINNEPLTIYGDGEQTRAFSWALDYCPLLLELANKKYDNEIINFGGDDFITLNEAKDLLLEIAGKQGHPVNYLEQRHEVKHAYCSHKKAKLYGLRHMTELEDIFKQTWEWALQQPNRPVLNWNKFEVTKGLYSFWK